MVSSATHLNFPPLLRSPNLFSLHPCFPSTLVFHLSLRPAPCALERLSRWLFSLHLLALGPGRTHGDSESSERYGSPRLSWLIPKLSPQCRRRQATLHPDTITATLFIRKVLGGNDCYHRALFGLSSLLPLRTRPFYIAWKKANGKLRATRYVSVWCIVIFNSVDTD